MDSAPIDRAPMDTARINSVVGVLLYGSRARGDATADSDVDLLVTTTGGRPYVSDSGRIAISCYPFDVMLRRARCGDLFAFHLVSDAKVLFERRPVLARLRRAFTFRADYRREIRMASDVGWCLLHHASRVADEPAFNRRMAWSAHTMLVGAAAEQRRAVFSADGLAAFAGLPRGRAGDPSQAQFDAESLACWPTSATSCTIADAPSRHRCPTSPPERARFDADRNPAGSAALRPLMAQ